MCRERTNWTSALSADLWIYHLATFQRSGGGGAKIRLSTRLNKLYASRSPLVCNSLDPPIFVWQVCHWFRELSIPRWTGWFWVLWGSRRNSDFFSLLQVQPTAALQHFFQRSTCCQRFAMAAKKNAKVLKSKGALLLLFLSHSILSWAAVVGGCVAAFSFHWQAFQS